MAHNSSSTYRIIADVVNTVMTIVGIQLIDRVGRRKLLLLGAAGMLICEFLVAIVGVTAGHPVQTLGGVAVNLAAQRVLIAFTCMLVVLFVVPIWLFRAFYAVTSPSTPSPGVLLFGCLRASFS
jgi:nitrate/nitrite transporter NarK